MRETPVARSASAAASVPMADASGRDQTEATMAAADPGVGDSQAGPLAGPSQVGDRQVVISTYITPEISCREAADSSHV